MSARVADSSVQATTDLLQVERLKTANELIHASACYQHLKATLSKCENDEERARVQAGVDHFREEVVRLGERMLQLAASVRVR